GLRLPVRRPRPHGRFANPRTVPFVPPSRFSAPGPKRPGAPMSTDPVDPLPMTESPLLPDTADAERELTPRQIVAELDKYIVGQTDAKKSVAIALRNRWRRLHAPEPMREEIMPNNIIMIGPT